MIKPKSIDKNRVLPKSMDYNFLKAEGIDIIQGLSGKIWTDFNEHDPGITILENICFALTELGYKTNFSIEDLFFFQDGKNKDFLKTFYKANEVLPLCPITSLDFRKIIIDQVAEVKNAWIVPKKVSATGNKLEGLSEVLIMVDQSKEDPDQIIAKVREVINANRNLCEDFEKIKILDPIDVTFSADIAIKANIVGENVYAMILKNILELFSPKIRLHNIDELLEAGMSFEEIYTNPVMENGYILDEDLINSEVSKVGKLFKSEIIRTISDIEGVEQVTNFRIFVDDEEINTELIQLEDYLIPNLNIEEIIEEDMISLYAGEITYNPDKDVVSYTLDSLISREIVEHKRWIDHDRKEFKSSRDKNEIEYYYSLQNTFPRNYGITDFGIPGKITDKRKAQVNQLQGYLYFFEQIIANYLSQLVNVDKLFSADAGLRKTYFYQELNYLNGFDNIVNQNGQFPKILNETINKFDKVEERRSRFLDHLLARFGEEFLSEAYTAIHRESSSYAKEDFINKTINSKITYLQNFVDISRNISKGFNYLKDYTDPRNTAGLKKRISLFFNFGSFGFKRLSEISSSKNIKISKGAKATAAKGQNLKFSSNNKNLLSDILGYGVDRNNYILDQQKKECIVSFKNPRTKEIIEINRSKTIKEADDVLTSFIDLFHEYNKQSEGFHLVEHILLRPINIGFKFSFTTNSNNVLFSQEDHQNVDYGKMKFVEKLGKFGTVKKNYKIESKSKKEFVLKLHDDAGNVIAYNDNFILKKPAEESIPDFIKEFKNINKSELGFKLQYEQTSNDLELFDVDPYSLQISLILPSWNGRFANEKMKFLFENAVKLNTPAHLRLNFVWFDIQEMKSFEDYYENWLKLKNQTPPEQPKLDQLSNILLLYILKKLNPENKRINELLNSAKAESKL